MNAHPQSVLVVEDSETQALKICMALEEQGWEARSAPSAEAALEEINRAAPDLVVLDQHLPGMQGDELCRRIRMNMDTRAIPILMLTSDQGDAAELRGLASGADDHVSKGADEEVLLLRIRTLLRKSQVQPAILGDSRSLIRRARLLLVDDSPTYLEFLAGKLGEEGYTLETADSGARALELVERDSFDCVLVDLVMPGLDGIEVCRRIDGMRRMMDNPIVVLMLTAHESKEDMTRGLEAGADDFIGKSSDLSVLKARIGSLLRRKFFQEENQRILKELGLRELEAVRARVQTEAAEVRAALADQLQGSNRELEEVNRKLVETQAQLIQTAKMASLGQLVAGIAHEINNPLAFVQNNAFTIGEGIEKLQVDMAAGRPEEAAKRLEKIRAQLASAEEGLKRVRDLVVKLRTFSRLDEGVFKTVDIHESIESVLLFLQHRMEERISVTKNYGPSRLLDCYPGPLNQVLLNITANAIEAIETEGTITITTGEENGEFLISVRDTGSGIPEVVREKIFDPFFTTKPVGQGTGLGLAISYSIVQSHKGQIEVRSVEGEGSEFTVRIPIDLERRIAS